ncbi:MAG: hypothetical protein DRP59_05395 [Spirochaetes bacterium]|nr:MAG: hypothetical protein DRP59_05395 [Spirochaetota bacterium]
MYISTHPDTFMSFTRYFNTHIIPIMSTENQIPMEEDEISLIDLLAVLLKHKKFIIIITLLGALGVLGFSIGSLLIPNEKSYYPNYYTPKAIVKINEDSGGFDLGSEAGGLTALLGMSVKSGATAFGAAQKYVTSDSFVDRIIKKFNLIDLYDLSGSKTPVASARKIFRENINLSDDSDSGTMEISYKDIDGALAADIVNEVVSLLDETFKNLSTDENVIQKKLLEKELSSTEAKLKDLEERLKKYNQKYGIYDIEAYAKEKATALGDLRSQYLKKVMEIESYRAYSSIEDPGLRKLRIERDSLKANIEKLEKGYSVGGIVVPSEKELPNLVSDYKKISLEYELQSKLYTSLAQQYELVKLKTSSIPPKFIVYEKAVPPLVKSGPSRGKLCIIVTMAVFFLSIFGAFILEFIGKIKQDPVEMAKLRGITK